MTPGPTFAAVAAAVARLDPARFAEARWFGGKGRPVQRLELAEAFDLGAGAILAAVDVLDGRGRGDRYLLPLRAGPADVGEAGAGDGAWRALAVAIAEGRTIAALARARPGTAPPSPEIPGPVTAALVCRPAAGLRELAPGGASEISLLDERPLGADQSNTSVVLGSRLILKAWRRQEPGLNPDLELNAWLSEEVGLPAVPRLAGYAEMVSPKGASTVAMLQEFVPGAEDAYESTAERLAAWILAPGEVTVEFATEEAAWLGELTANLHAALASATGVPGLEPREATRDELRAWRRAAEAQLDRALEVVHGPAGDELRAMAAAIGEQLTVFEALPAVPVLTRAHGDYHLGQVLRAPDGYRIIDFEGEPTRPLEERRRHNSPLRDVASMLRSIDHVGRSARRRAETRRGGPVESPGLDVEAWLVRARERFLEAYARRLRELGSPIEVDPDLLQAFEFEKETYEFIYAANWLPEWLWAPLEGMRALVAHAARAAP